MNRQYTFNHATVGGTFDRLHTGHQAMLREAFRIAERVTVAVTSDRFPRSKQYAHAIGTYKERVDELLRYLREQGLEGRSIIVPIDDPYGPAPTDATMDAIVVSRETYTTAKRINDLRRNASLPPLHIHTVGYVKGSDSRIVRSSRIRKGEVNRNGRPYYSVFLEHRTLSLPESLRSALRNPMGIVIEGTEDSFDKTAADTVRAVRSMNPPYVITVGDIVYDTLGRAGLMPDIAIIDHRNNRQTIARTEPSAAAKINRAGTLMPGAVELVKKAFSDMGKGNRCTVTVRGEEDLLALPAILFAPLGTLVIYGQYGTGIVIVPVTEAIKDSVKSMVEQFV